jgi:hypothetical protein
MGMEGEAHEANTFSPLFSAQLDSLMASAQAAADAAVQQGNGKVGPVFASFLARMVSKTSSCAHLR